MILAPAKHPDSTKWYWLEWSACELGEATLTDAAWTLPAGLVSLAESVATRSAGIKLAGGVQGTRYELTLAITTSAGETLYESVRLLCDAAAGH